MRCRDVVCTVKLCKSVRKLSEVILLGCGSATAEMTRIFQSFLECQHMPCGHKGKTLTHSHTCFYWCTHTHTHSAACTHTQFRSYEKKKKLPSHQISKQTLELSNNIDSAFTCQLINMDSPRCTSPVGLCVLLRVNQTILYSSPTVLQYNEYYTNREDYEWLIKTKLVRIVLLLTHSIPCVHTHTHTHAHSHTYIHTHTHTLT